jgi:RNA 2',3'-cyclic 3'-phosphodiesterase
LDTTTVSEKQWRLFIALELPAEVRRKISQHSDHLRTEMPDVRASWTREPNLHLTLKFLGDVPIERVEAVSRALQRATTGAAPFEMEIRGCGAFPTRGHPKVLWIGISDGPQLPSLHEAIEREVGRLGFPREGRPFHPHLTIARLRQPQGARALADLHERSGFPPMLVNVKDDLG